MPTCISCRGIGKIIDKKFKATITCPDCDGHGTVSENMLKFIQFYNNKKSIENEISNLEKNNEFIEQYQQVMDS